MFPNSKFQFHSGILEIGWSERCYDEKRVKDSRHFLFRGQWLRLCNKVSLQELIEIYEKKTSKRRNTSHVFKSGKNRKLECICFYNLLLIIHNYQQSTAICINTILIFYCQFQSNCGSYFRLILQYRF